MELSRNCVVHFLQQELKIQNEINKLQNIFLIGLKFGLIKQYVYTYKYQGGIWD